MIYLNVFSTLEPRYNALRETEKQVEEKKLYTHYFTQEGINKYFSDFELILRFEGLEYDYGHRNPHYHCGIKFMARKKGFK